MTPWYANRSNIPQLRAIKIFYTNMMQKLYSNNFVAKTEEERMVKDLFLRENLNNFLSKHTHKGK